MTNSSDQLIIQHRKTREAWFVDLAGPVNRLTCEELRKELMTLAASGPLTTQVSFADVPILDSAGIGMLVTVKKAYATAKRHLILKDVPPQIGQVLKLLRLYEILVVDF